MSGACVGRVLGLVLVVSLAASVAARTEEFEEPALPDSSMAVAETLVVDSVAPVPEPVVEPEKGPLDRDLMTASGVVRVLTPVSGDLFVAGGEVAVNSTVKGDVWASGGIVNVSGTADGDVRAAGYRVTLGGVVKSGALVFSNSFVQESASEVWGDIIFYCEKARLLGITQGSIKGTARVMTIEGSVEGGVNVRAERVVIGSEALIGGDLIYESPNEAVIGQGARVLGGVIRTEPKGEGAAEPGPGGILGFSTSMKLVWFIGMILAGLVLCVFASDTLDRTDKTLRSSPFVSLLAGFVLLVCVPFGLIVLFVAVVGWPLMVMLALLYLAAVIFSGIFVGLSVGRLVLLKSERAQTSVFWPMALGLLLLVIVSAIPVIGFLIRLFIVMFGVGGLWMSQWRYFRGG
jgi:hypothetical protein